MHGRKAEKFGSKKETGSDTTSISLVRGEKISDSDQKMASDAISFMSNETDRSHGVQRSGHKNSGK